MDRVYELKIAYRRVPGVDPDAHDATFRKGRVVKSENAGDVHTVWFTDYEYHCGDCVYSNVEDFLGVNPDYAVNEDGTDINLEAIDENVSFAENGRRYTFDYNDVNVPGYPDPLAVESDVVREITDETWYKAAGE